MDLSNFDESLKAIYLKAIKESLDKEPDSMIVPNWLKERLQKSLTGGRNIELPVSLTEIIDVLCPTHDKPLERKAVGYYGTNYGNAMMRMVCPVKDCGFEITINPEIIDGIITAYMVMNEASIRMRLKTGGLLQFPVCPLCTIPLLPGSNRDWICKSCKFNLKDDYFARFRGTQQQPIRDLKGDLAKMFTAAGAAPPSQREMNLLQRLDVERELSKRALARGRATAVAAITDLGYPQITKALDWIEANSPTADELARLMQIFFENPEEFLKACPNARLTELAGMPLQTRVISLEDE